ncbi:MAG: alpha-galactosidase [Corallococcus sp.]|nr:alpha-galactosidase [Corallococcus sp.]MCM1359756.1 alpha-galactosidase [Corallococcus sp.]MCM1395718.1 alpha-galactosidase [Corallococcus sp.]
MIRYNSASKTFHLQGKNVSYIFFADEHGFLRHLYFGEKLPTEENARHLAQTAYLGAAVNFDGATLPNDNLNAMLLETSVGQMGDYRRPSVVLEMPNGSRLTDFRYVGYEVLHGRVLPEPLPCARGGETLKVDMRDEVNNLTLSLYYTVFDDSDAVVRSASVFNGGKNPVSVCKLASFNLDLYDSDKDTVQLVGNWASERQIVRRSAHSGILQITDGARGESSHCFNPFLALVDGSATETQGETLGVNLVYSGSFSITCENNSLKSTRLQGGIDAENFRWYLPSGEAFYSPQAVLVYSCEGLGGMSRAFHDFYREHLMDPAFAKTQRPVVVNNWEATYFNFDAQKLKDIADVATEVGADTFVLDDGWFTNRSDDTNGLGDWQIDFEKLPGGLAAISEYCHKRGLKFGLWFEPEMVNVGTRLFAERPEWALCCPNRRGRAFGRNQLVLDFANPDVVEYIYEKMRGIISEYGVDYVKWDMNRYLADLYSVSLPHGRQGEFTHRYVLGVYSLALRLRRNFPDLFIEGCSGGGGRFDAGMLYYFPQIWTSDNTDAYLRTFIQNGTSLCYPMSAMSAHFSTVPNHQSQRTVSFDARYNVACTCSFGYELDLTALSAEERQQIKAQIARYRRDADLVITGDVYRLTDATEDSLWAVCQVSKDKTKARLVGLHGLILENARGRLLKVFGLRDDFYYEIEELGVTVCGKTLRAAGIILPQTFADFATFQLHLTATVKNKNTPEEIGRVQK